jgi:Flp pilus assembly pilin Flp
MQTFLLKLYAIARSRLACEEAQDLTEYALVFSVIALGTVAGMDNIASSVNRVFVVVANTLTTAV